MFFFFFFSCSFPCRFVPHTERERLSAVARPLRDGGARVSGGGRSPGCSTDLVMSPSIKETPLPSSPPPQSVETFPRVAVRRKLTGCEAVRKEPAAASRRAAPRAATGAQWLTACRSGRAELQPQIMIPIFRERPKKKSAAYFFPQYVFIKTYTTAYLAYIN